MTTANAKDRQGYINMAICFTVLLILGYLSTVFRPVELDQNLCVKNAQLQHHLIVMIDATDPMAPDQTNFWLQKVRELGSGLKRGEKLSIIPIDGRLSQIAAPVFSVCNPGKKEDFHWWNANPTKAQERYDQKFANELEHKLKQFESVISANWSPILESIHTVLLRPDFSSKVSSRHLVLVSDLLQNVPQYSHYRHAIDFHILAKTAYYRQVKVNLKDVRSDVYFVDRRLDDRRIDKIKTFWQQFFHTNGSEVEIVDQYSS